MTEHPEEVWIDYPPEVWEVLESLYNNAGVPARLRKERWLDVCWGIGLIEFCSHDEPSLVIPLAVPNDGLAPSLTTRGLTLLKFRDYYSATEPAKGKSGRKSTADDDAKTYAEYEAGRADGRWTTQVDFLKTKYPDRYRKNRNAAKSWLSQKLDRGRAAIEVK